MISLGLRYFLKSRAAARSPPPPAPQRGVGGQPADQAGGRAGHRFRASGARHGAQRRGRQLATTPAPPRGGRARRHRDPPSRRAGDVTVRLACTEGFAHRFLPQCMAEFKRLRRRALSPAGRAARRSAACWKASRKSDCVTPRSTDDRLSTEVLCRAPVYAVMCRRHALAVAGVSVRSPLARLPLSLATRAPRAQLFDAACANAGLHEPACVSNHSAAFLPMLAGSDRIPATLTVGGQLTRCAWPPCRSAIRKCASAACRRRRCRAHAAGTGAGVHACWPAAISWPCPA